jgi:Domain of Unknown Function (DUF1080)
MLTAAIAVAVLLAKPSAPPAKQPPREAQTQAAKPSVPEASKVALFNGKSLEGWKVFVPEGKADGLWTVRDGVLVCAGNPIGYIVTEKEYQNFELTLEWRFDPAKGAGNSGVLLRVQQPDKVWPKSVEAQLHSRNAGDIWNIDDVTMKADVSRTEGRRTKKMHETNEKPLGEWNRYRIVVDGGKLELYVNDLLQNAATDVDTTPGRIGLQSEGAHIEFRAIELRELPASPVAGKAPAAAKR